MLCNARGYCTNVFCCARGLGSKSVINNCSKVILTKNMQGMKQEKDIINLCADETETN